MKEGMEMVQPKSEVSGEEMFNKLEAIRSLPDAASRVAAWEQYIRTYEDQNLNDMCEGILWRAETYLKIDKASADISEVVG